MKTPGGVVALVGGVSGGGGGGDGDGDGDALLSSLLRKRRRPDDGPAARAARLTDHHRHLAMGRLIDMNTCVGTYNLDGMI